MLTSVMSKQKALYAGLILTLGVIVGIASSVTDSVPYGAVDRTVLSAMAQLFTGVINSVVVWFAVPFMLGYLLCRSWKQSAVVGGAFMAAAILSYSVHGWVKPNTMDLEVSTASIISNLLEMLTIAIVGGVIGGVTGFFAQKRTSVLLVLVLVIIAELARRGAFSWQSPISAGENIVFIVGAIAIVVYVVSAIRKTKKRRMET